MRLRGENVYLTGAAGGLGSALVPALLREGCTVICLDIKEMPRHLYGENEVLYRQVDLLDSSATEAIVEEISELTGTPAAIINAAGLIHSEAFIKLSPSIVRHEVDVFRKVLASHLDSAFNITGSVVARMIAARKRGAIINIGSVNAEGVAGQSAYSAAKAGLSALSSVWSKELGALGIRSVCIEPGYIDSPPLREALSDLEIQKVKERTPTRQLVPMQDVVSMVIFALKTESLNGTSIKVDMGLRN